MKPTTKHIEALIMSNADFCKKLVEAKINQTNRHGYPQHDKINPKRILKKFLQAELA